MLRYFYLIILCLLICIKWSFCYDYISEQHSHRPVRKLRKDTGFRHSRHITVDRSHYRDVKSHEYENPVAQIDVASFIQKPDYDAVDENNPHKNQHTNGRHVSKDYSDYGSVLGHDLVYINQGKGKNHPMSEVGNSGNFNIRPDFDISDAKSSFSKENDFSDQSTVHKHKKKCSMKQINFPFFSHKKTVTPKPKKNNKRKLFCLNKNNKKVTNNAPKLSEPKVNNDNKNLGDLYYKVEKRSYEERVCPLCNSKFIVNSNNGLYLDNKIDSSRQIHNSRQFYQDVSNASKEKTSEHMSNVNDALDSDSFEERNTKENSANIDYREDRRRKRDDERERQMKELEEVQKKIDGVEIQSPTSPKDRYDVNIS